MKQIYNFELPICQRQCVAMPRGSQVLSVTVVEKPKGDVLNLAALADVQSPTEARHIRMYGPGTEIKDAEPLTYLASVTLAAGRLMMHVFEAKA